MFKDIQKKYLLLILLPLILFIFVPMTFSKYSKSINQQIGLNISDPTYTVVFNANGGTGTMADQTFSYKTSQSLRANDFTNGDLVFLEWNTQANGSGESYYNQQTVDRLSGINGDTVTLYAQWGSKVAKIGNTYYDTLQEAVDDVPNTDVETIVILLQNTSETITVDEGQNIVFDFRNNTLSNKGNTAVITNDGTISISNGTILSSAASNGAINNNSKGTITISGGSVIVTGGRQALYNNKGTATITGTAHLESSATARSAVQNVSSGKLYIESGTIISTGTSAVTNAGTLLVGVKDGVVSTTTPLIQGVDMAITSSTTYKVYDGIFKGINNSFNDETKIIEFEPGYGLFPSTEIIDGVTYEVNYLSPSVKVTFDPVGGIVNPTFKNIIFGNELGPIPTPIKSGHTFNGWYDDQYGGNPVDEHLIVTSEKTIYAHWTKSSQVALMNGRYYDTLREAIAAAPQNTSTTITMVKDVEEIINVASGKDIILDLNNHTLTNCGNKYVIENYGDLTIQNGSITSSADVGAVDNREGNLTIDNVNIIATGTRQALYIYDGIVEIKGNSYLSSRTSGTPNGSTMERGTVQCLGPGTIIITSGTIVGEIQQAVSNEGTLIIGTKDGNIDATNPVLIGEVYGLKTTGTFKYYDGIIKGKTDSINGTITEQEDNSTLIDSTEVISGSTYYTSYLQTQ